MNSKSKLVKKGKIGVFDSGFGGLSILKHIVKKLPEYDYVYLGDSARAPYGEKSHATILKFTKEALVFMFNSGCEIVVLACNSASSEALREIQQKFLPKYFPDKKVLGVIIPTVEKVLEEKSNKKIAVLATNATVRSGTFVKEIQKRKPQVFVNQVACPLLVPLVESGKEKSKEAEVAVRDYLSCLQKEKIDALILGCTHYEFLSSVIKKNIGKKVKVFSEGSIVAVKFKDYLKRHIEIEEKLSKKGKVEFFSTKPSLDFDIFGSKFFGSQIHADNVKLSNVPQKKTI
ncbi:MAG: glutamate racemase [Patescibacteria group bacterium]|jgi:glutamate racemase|nr:glutamate racemase [Patescibacteria group bacterium]